MSKRPIAVCDCETDPFKNNRVPRPFVWGYYTGSEYREFRSTKKFAAFLKEQNVICYAHNGGKFDWHFLLDHVDAYEEIGLINGRIAKMRLGAAECRDSYCIIPVPLAAYKKDDIDYSIMEEGERDKPANKAKISEYLKSDCVYLFELVSRFIDEYGMNLTQAGAAMKQWSKLSPLPVPRTDGVFYEQFAPYYYGGRVECFAAGIVEQDFSVFDINSAYPFAMLHKHPYSDNFSHVEGYAKGADFYRVRCISAGAFPYRGEGGNAFGAGLSFPSDMVPREYTVTGWEYSAAVATRTIQRAKVLESITFVNHVDFADYIHYFFNKRLECKAKGDEAGSLFCKLFMNGLYGKFAANPDNYHNYMVVPMDVIAGLDAVGWQFAGEFGPWGLAQAELSEERKRYYNVATGASITGFVRAMLWRAIHGSKGVLYCDTDSIAVERPGKSVVLGDQLGQWKHEGDFDRAGIAGKKLYIFRGKRDSNGHREYKAASKGVRLTHAELWKVAKGGLVDYAPQVPTFSPKKAPVFTERQVRMTTKAKG